MRRLVGLVVLTAFLGLATLLVDDHYERAGEALRRNGVSTAGHVFAVHHPVKGITSVEVSYVTAGGPRIATQRGVDRTAYGVGDDVTVFYDARRPDRMVVMDEGALTLVGSVLENGLLIGAVFGFAAAITAGWERWRGHGRGTGRPRS